MKSANSFKPQLLENNGTTFRWAGTIIGESILSATHIFNFVPLYDGKRTKFEQNELNHRFSRNYESHVWQDKLKEAFESMNVALKKRCEEQ